MAFGIYGMVSAVLRWDAFAGMSRIQGAVQLLGHTGARILYFLLGLACFAAGMGLLTGWIPEAMWRTQG